MGRRSGSLRRLRGGEREAHARRVLSRWEASGRSAGAFCRSEGIAPATFYRWRRLFAGGGPDEAGPVRFLKVDVVRGGVPGALEVELQDGRRVRVGAGFDAGDLERLLRVLVQTTC